ncbi:hypothetical protein SAMN05660690_4312 [Geodermatophilus telluris]|uniref:Protein phosphatase 2C n=1 Tax=Geodermatophilus telluris TaxID=1190417 RepID=A0A1G6V2P8_9ACTN|nr:hypothetical protein [Geodermatophilus telluris]SDD47764.1 hypothetical protein SAMN05660690_4312 [Geodermatophilus telluris]
MADRVTTAVELVAFAVAKAGSADAEWEDGTGYDPGDPRTGRPARLVVADGATEAYDAAHWVGQLVDAFLAPDGRAPALDPAGLDAWFGRQQQVWAGAPRAFATVFEEHKFLESGSFATFLGCEVHGLGGPEPRWVAAALGDTVLFHVRDGRVLAQVPDLAAEDFGVTPDGVSTQPGQRARMRGALRTRDGALRVGDCLLLATDALAEWVVRAVRDGDARWRELTSVDHPQVFRDLVDRLRAAGDVRNDDVTLLRAHVTPTEAGVLVICR